MAAEERDGTVFVNAHQVFDSPGTPVRSTAFNLSGTSRIVAVDICGFPTAPHTMRLSRSAMFRITKYPRVQLTTRRCCVVMQKILWLSSLAGVTTN
jgi:hypothetical protein